MGQTEVKFQCSEGLDGQPLVVSDPIDNLTPEQFWNMLENYLRNRPIDPNGYDIAYNVRDLDDGGFVTALTAQLSGAITLVMGPVSGTIHAKHYFRREEDMYVFYNYYTDETLSDDGLSEIGYLKAELDPFRLEFYMDEKPCRMHGIIIQNGTAAALKKANLEAEVLASQPSPVDEGKKSCLTGPLPGMTIDKLYEIMKKQALDDHGTELPNGSVLTEQEGLISTTYKTLSMSEDGSMVVVRSFGKDDSLQELEMTWSHRLFGEPPRLEVWGQKVERRDGGVKSLSIIDSIVKGAVEFAASENS